MEFGIIYVLIWKEVEWLYIFLLKKGVEFGMYYGGMIDLVWKDW